MIFSHSLLFAKASVQSTDKDGLTALHCAASRGNHDCIETLVGLCGAGTTFKKYTYMNYFNSKDCTYF